MKKKVMFSNLSMKPLKNGAQCLGLILQKMIKFGSILPTQCVEQASLHTYNSWV